MLNILFNDVKNKKSILLWYGNKMRLVPISVFYRKFLTEYFDLRLLTDAISIQIYFDNVIRIRYETYGNLFIDDASQEAIDIFLEILNSDEDCYAFNNRFKAIEIDQDSGIHIIVKKNDTHGVFFNELPIKVYGFLKPIKLSSGEINFSHQNICDEILHSELEDIEENLKEDLKSRQF